MNCEGVQKQLWDFLDESVELERAKEIQDHLDICSACSEEAASLVECRRLVSSLPAVEPPVGFTARVMAQVRDGARHPSLWQRLFLPFQIKIPLQATAVILIGFLAAYIYQKEPLQREPVTTFRPENSPGKQDETDKWVPSVAQAPRTDAREAEVAEEGKLQIEEFKVPAQRKEAQLPPEPEELSKSIADSRSGAPAALNPPTPLREKPSAAEATSPQLGPSSASGGARAKRTPPPIPQPATENISKDAAPAGKSLASPETRERSAAPSLDALSSGAVVGGALTADHEVTIRLKEPMSDEKAAGDPLASGRAQAKRRSLTREEAKNLDQARKRVIQSGQAQTVWITIAPSQYELFKKEFADLGNIEAESSPTESKNEAVAQSSDQLRIKVTMLPPPSSANPPSPQPSSR
jgi:hypothetical protein